MRLQLTIRRCGTPFWRAVLAWFACANPATEPDGSGSLHDLQDLAERIALPVDSQERRALADVDPGNGPLGLGGDGDRLAVGVRGGYRDRIGAVRQLVAV